MTDIQRVVAEIVPAMYADIGADYPYGYNLAGSNQCHVLSKGLWIALRQRDIEARREFHKAPNGDWHFLVAHSPLGAEPSDSDIVTDLNPWQFMQSPPLHRTFLHGPRGEVMAAMQEQGASSHVRSLRALSTIAITHTADIHPPL